MSTLLQRNPATTDIRGQAWHPRAEAVQAMRFIKEAIMSLLPEGGYTETETSIEYPVMYGRCMIRMKPLDGITSDGRLFRERFEAITTLTVPLDDFDDDFYLSVNRLATTGAVVRCPESGAAHIASGVSVAEGDTETLMHLFAPLLVYSSLAQSMSLREPMQKTFGIDLLGDLGDQFGFPGGDEPSRWQPGEFEHAAALMEQAGIFCNAGDNGLTAEFAWDAGAVSAVTGERTSLMRFENDVTHPTAGNGLRFALYLPISADESHLHTLAIELNNVEIYGTDVPPCFGAWAVSPDGRSLVFQGFWPNCMYQPGAVANIAMWCHGRSGLAKQVIERFEAATH